MILAVDIGNSNITIGGYENDALSFSTRITTEKGLEPDQYAIELGGILNLYNIQKGDIDGVIISSVVPRVTDAVKAALARFSCTPPVMFTKENAQVAIAIDDPGELGLDILASAVTVTKQYALPAAIIDMGTATTVTAVGKNGAVEGVSIFPGLFVGLDAVTQHTSALRGIEIKAPECAIGKNTRLSLQSGIVFGNAAMLDGLLDRFEAELGTLASVAATGGAAGLVTQHCRRHITFSPSLLLDGLYYTYKAQQKAPQP